MFLFIIESQLDKNILRLYTHLVWVTLCKGDQSMRIALCDDNEQDLNYYSDLICTLAKEKNIAIEVVRFETGEQALFHISNNEKPIDILLLDIHMPGINGIETGLKLRQAPFHFHGEIVFVTVSSDYAIDAFDVQAFHYIVKGITSTEKTNAILTNALNKAVEKEQEFILLKGIGEYRNIPIQSIYYFEVFQRIITVHYDNNEQFEFYSSIGKLEITVLPKGFLRIHRSYIVSVSQIKTFNSTSLTLMNGKELPVGRKYLPNLKTAFQTPENVI